MSKAFDRVWHEGLLKRFEAEGITGHLLTWFHSYLSDRRQRAVPIVGVCNDSMFRCTLLSVNSSIAIILMGKRELIALLDLSSWCLVMVERLFLAVPRGCLQFVIVVFPDHTHSLFFFLLCSLHGTSSGLEFHKGLFWDHLFLLFINDIVTDTGSNIRWWN